MRVVGCMCVLLDVCVCVGGCMYVYTLRSLLLPDRESGQRPGALQRPARRLPGILHPTQGNYHPHRLRIHSSTNLANLITYLAPYT